MTEIIVRSNSLCTRIPAVRLYSLPIISGQRGSWDNYSNPIHRMYIYIYYVYMHIYMYVKYIYIRIYREREKEGKKCNCNYYSNYDS